MNQIEIYDIYDLWYIPAWWEKKSTWLIAGSCVVIVLLFIAVYYLWKKKKNMRETSEQKALKMLAFLESQKNLLTHQELYLKITALLKEIFYARYGFLFRGKTDTEFLSNVKELSISQDIHSALADILKGVELVKFAHQKTVITKRDEDLIRCKYIIEKIYQKESQKND